jgi:hypothetical protein
MKTIKVDKCSFNCPFMYYDQKYWCNHPDAMHEELTNIIIPLWCPLKKEPIKIELKVSF